MKSVIIAFLLLSLCFIPLASASTSVLITPSTKVLTVGETFTVSLIVTPDQEVDTVAVDLLTWNNNVLECIDIEKGNFFTNPLIWMPGNIHNDAGELKLMLMAASTSTEIPNILCNITFRAKNPGSSTIEIELLGIARNGIDLPKEILNSCQIIVEGPPPGNGGDSQQTTPDENTTENQTLPPTNETNNTTPVNTTNETQPITTDNSIDNSTQSNIEADNDLGLPDDIPPTIIYAIVIIIAVSVISIIIIHHYREKQEEEEDEDFDIDEFLKNRKGAEDGKTDSGSEL